MGKLRADSFSISGGLVGLLNACFCLPREQTLLSACAGASWAGVSPLALSLVFV